MKKETIWGLLLLALLTCQSAKAYAQQGQSLLCDPSF